MTFKEWWEKEISKENMSAGNDIPTKMMCMRAYAAGKEFAEEAEAFRRANDPNTKYVPLDDVIAEIETESA